MSKQTPEQTFAKFATFHTDNKFIMEAIPRLINIMQRHGWGGFGFGFVLDCLRFHKDYRFLRVSIKGQDCDFMLPNSFHSMYLQALCIWKPEHINLFGKEKELRASAGTKMKGEITRLTELVDQARVLIQGYWSNDTVGSDAIIEHDNKAEEWLRKVENK